MEAEPKPPVPKPLIPVEAEGLLDPKVVVAVGASGAREGVPPKLNPPVVDVLPKFIRLI